MITTNAVFMRKENSYKTEECVVEKIIRLSGKDFDNFSSNLLQDWDFIRDNAEYMRCDKNNKQHCLLIVGEGRRDGILVDSSGYSYARYSTLIPNVESFLTTAQYPALAELNKKLTGIVEYIAEQSKDKSNINLNDLETVFGIDLMTNGTLCSTILDMLSARDDINDFELDKNELIIQHKDAKLENAAETLSDPTVSMADMFAYGYGWGGMIPLGKERALELFEKNYAVYLLNPDDTEGAVDTRAEIESFDGIFGIENPEWVEEKGGAPIEISILNQELYDKGETACEWLKLPASAEDLSALFERIGIEKLDGTAVSITAVRTPHECIRDYISKYDSINELNMLAAYLHNMEDFQFDKFKAILTSGIMYIGREASDLINIIYPENFDAFILIDASNTEELGKYYSAEKPYEVDFAKYGASIVSDEGGCFSDYGYLYFRNKELSQEYKGIVPNEHRIFGEAFEILREKMKSETNKSSVIEQIKTNMQAVSGQEKKQRRETEER